MPRKFRKKQRKHRRKKYQKLVSMGAPSGAPTIRVANLRFVEMSNLACSAGVLNQRQYRANSIGEPSVTTGSAHQPMGHDQWALFYNHYVVLGAKITVKIINDGTISPAYCGIYLSDGTTTPYVNGYEFIEARKGTYRMIQQNNPQTLTISSKFSAKRYFNVTDVKDNISRLGASMATSPTEQAVFGLWYQTLDASSDTIRYTATVDYIVQFSEPRDLTKS